MRVASQRMGDNAENEENETGFPLVATFYFGKVGETHCVLCIMPECDDEDAAILTADDTLDQLKAANLAGDECEALTAVVMQTEAFLLSKPMCENRKAAACLSAMLNGTSRRVTNYEGVENREDDWLGAYWKDRLRVMIAELAGQP